jgi:hypothetical protein
MGLTAIIRMPVKEVSHLLAAGRISKDPMVLKILPLISLAEFLNAYIPECFL